MFSFIVTAVCDFTRSFIFLLMEVLEKLCFFIWLKKIAKPSFMWLLLEYMLLYYFFCLMRFKRKIFFRGDEFGVKLWCKYIMMKYQFDTYIVLCTKFIIYFLLQTILFQTSDSPSNTLVIVEENKYSNWLMVKVK